MVGVTSHIFQPDVSKIKIFYAFMNNDTKKAPPIQERPSSILDPLRQLGRHVF